MKALRPAATVVGAVLAVALAWLVAAEADIPAGGLSREQATTLAFHQVQSDTPPESRLAVPGPFLLFRGGATDAVSPWYRMVWAITFSGTFQSSCGPAPLPGQTAHCPPPNHMETVVLDFRTGDFIMASIEP